MDNFSDDTLNQSSDSFSNILGKNHNLDTHNDYNNPYPDYSSPDLQQLHSFHHDPLNSGTDAAHLGHQNDFHQAGLKDLHHSIGDCFAATSDSNHCNDNTTNPLSSLEGNLLDSDYTNLLPEPSSANSHQPDFEHSASAKMSFADNNSYGTFACSKSSDHYVTMNSYGQIYKDGQYQVGYVKQRSVYNSSDLYLGYGSTNGNIYDYKDRCVGWFDCGNVYNTAGQKIYHTNGGVVQGAAYLLLVYLGGVR